MKKLVILSTITFLFIFLSSGLTSAQTIDNSMLVGKWQLCDESGNLVKNGNARVKIITTESFTVTEINQDIKALSIYFIGSYELKDGVYAETITFANSQLQSFIGQTNKFGIELKGELMYLKGMGNPYNEVWRRISK